jgi:hypothetical protein
MLGECHDLDVIGIGQVRTEQEKTREVKLAAGDRLEQRRELSYETRGLGSTKRAVFGEAELVDAVRVEARAAALAMDPTSFDLGEVSEERCQDLIRAANEASSAREKLVVGELAETEIGRGIIVHARHLTPRISELENRVRSGFWAGGSRFLSPDPAKRASVAPGARNAMSYDTWSIATSLVAKKLSSEIAPACAFSRLCHGRAGKLASRVLRVLNLGV